MRLIVFMSFEVKLIDFYIVCILFKKNVRM